MSERVAFQGFVGSAFHAQSKRFDTQDLWNWYVERAGSPYSKAAQALLPCPGFQVFATLPTGPVRGLFAQNDRTFAVAGTQLYELTTVGGFFVRGQTQLTNYPVQPTITVSPLTPPLPPPLMPVVTHGGALGTTTYGYQITALNDLGETTGSPQGQSTFGYATLSGTNWNIISWSAVEGCTKYRIYRITGGTSPRLLRTVASTTLVFHDIGQEGDTTPLPTSNTTGGQPGTTTYGYKITATLGLGETMGSAEAFTTVGPSPLTSVNYTIITWPKVINARGYKVYRTTGGVSPPRLIAEVAGGDTLTVRDTGEEGEAGAPSSTVNTTGQADIANDGAPVTFASSGDAGKQLFFVSGGFGYCYDLETNVLAPVIQGATSGGFIDSYFVALDAFDSTLKVSESFEGFVWDPTQVYQRSRAGDKWLSMAVTSNNIWLIGTQTGEVWTGTGQPDTRFSPYLPVFIETGVIAAHSMIRVSGDTMMWVAQDKDGAGYVVRTNGYNPEKVSTVAVDHSMQGLHAITDASAFSYQQEGHTFYVVTFPTEKVTWVYDLTTNEWHRRGYWDADVMGFIAYRPQCHAFAFGAVGVGMNLVGDRSSGIVAKMRQEYGSDLGRAVHGETPSGAIDGVNRVFTTAAAYTNLIVYLNGERQTLGTHYTETTPTTFTFMIAPPPPGATVTVDYYSASVIRRVRQCPVVAALDKEMTFDRLQMDMDVGEGIAVGQGSDPTIMLIYSNDNGNTWGSELWRSAGKQGVFRIQVAWSRLGTAKNRVFRLVVSDPVPWRLVGAWLELEGS